MELDVITATVDASKVMAKLSAMESKEPKVTNTAVQDVAEEALRLSQREVPHDEGTLQNSGNVQPAGQDWTLGYHTRYAARLHEHPEYRFQKGRKGKYLEDPIRHNQKRLGLRFARHVDINLLRGL